MLDVFKLFERNLYYSNTFYFAIILEYIFLKVLGTSWTLRQQFGTMLPVNQTLLPLKDKSILIYHGSADDVIDVNESIKIYDKLKSIDSKNIELKIIENDNHFLTSHAFKDKYLYEWLEKNI